MQSEINELFNFGALKNIFTWWSGFRSPARPSQGQLTPDEVGVLKDSSYVNGKLFMPWIADDLQVT